MSGELDPTLIAVPHVSVESLADALTQDRLIGWVTDGDAFGVAGHVLALLVGDESTIAVEGDQEFTFEPIDDVVGRFAQRWPGTVKVAEDGKVGDVELSFPSSVACHLPFAAVAVTPPADLILGYLVSKYGVELETANVDGRVIIGMREPADMADDFLDAALIGSRGVSTVLWRRGPVTSLSVLRKGDLRQVHWWAPEWLPVGSPEVAELRDLLGTPKGDAAEIADLLGISDDTVVLRALLRRRNPGVAQIVETLGLPEVVTEILEGRTTVAELPGGSVVEPETLGETIKSAVRSSEHDPAWIKWLDEGARELRPWYLVSSLVTVILGVLIMNEAGGIGWFRGTFGFVFVLGVVIDLPVRWWLRRKRRREAAQAL